MKIILSSIFTLCLGQVLVAQTYEWTKTFGSSLSDQATAITTDNSGNTYTAVYLKGDIDFDAGPGTALVTVQGATDAAIVKTNPQGNVIWAKGFGGPNAYVHIYDLEIDPAGNVIAVGNFSNGTVDFDPNAGVIPVGSGFGAGTDGFVLKLNSSGSYLWMNPFDGTGSTELKTVTADVVGNIYVSGHYSAQTDFDPSAGGTNYVTAVGGTNGFILKLEPAGVLTWTKFISGSNVFISDGSLDAGTGQYVVTGSFSGTPDFDPNGGVINITSNGNADAFVAKYTTAGNLTWVKSFGTATMSSIPSAMVTDNEGNIFTIGQFNHETYAATGSIDFDPSIGEAFINATGNEDLYIHKIDLSGNFLWVKALTGAGSQIANDIAVDASNNIYVTGLFSGTTDMDPNAAVDNRVANFYDMYVLKLSEFGNKIWAKTVGGPSAFVSGFKIATDASNNVYTAGFFYETADFNPSAGVDNIAAIGSHDIFLQKLSECTPNSGTAVHLECGSSYTWINGVTYNSDNNTATHTLQNQGGCDSVVTLNLTFVASYAFNEVVYNCGPYTWMNGVTYNSSINTTYELTSVNGCDSIYNLSLTVIAPLDNSVTVGTTTLTSNAFDANYQWFNCTTNTEISGETNAVFTPTADGVYACIVDNVTCVDTTACTTFSMLGIGEYSLGELNVYPNPGNDIITISTTVPTNRVIVYNSLGAIVLETSLSTLSVSSWSTGVYMIEAVSDLGSMRTRFIKN